MVELGDRVKDKITQLEGIAIGITNWLFGCRRIVVQPETAKDGKPAETFCVDEPQLELLDKEVITPFGKKEQADKSVAPERTHGVREDPAPRKDPVR